MRDIKGLSLKELSESLTRWGERPFHARQIFDWIYKKGIMDFSLMSDLSSGLRARLKNDFYVVGLDLAKKVKSKDGTEKFLLQLKDGDLIESVIIPAAKRVTGCVSTQAGCKFACAFCASGVSGFKRDLSHLEIIDEALYLKNGSSGNKLTHLVFMGVGEPLDNYDNVLKAIRQINLPETMNIGARRITISTCGIIPGIKRLAGEGMQIELSVSLHASDDETRSRLMPVNKKYPLRELIKACGDYAGKTNRQVTFEYILIEGVNSGLRDARNLIKILKGLNCKVNLIPCNPVKESGIMPPSQTSAWLFRGALMNGGLNVTLRGKRGDDIEAACGQLRLRYGKK